MEKNLDGRGIGLKKILAGLALANLPLAFLKRRYL